MRPAASTYNTHSWCMYFVIWLLRFLSAEESSRTLGLVLVGDAAVEFYRPGAVPDGLEVQLSPKPVTGTAPATLKCK